MSARGLLVSGLAFFENDPLVHTTGALARDANSNPVPAINPHAVCWCTLGFLLKQAGVGSLEHPDVAAASHYLQLAAVEMGHLSVTRCNDTLRRFGAVSMYRRAVELQSEAAPVALATTGGGAS